MADTGEDIVDLILEDHRPLKRLLKVLKDETAELKDVQNAFMEFVPLLTMHARPEEQTLYAFLKSIDASLRMEAFEGDVEHDLADQMVEEAKRTTDRSLWRARVKVLAELVDHHIREEENELLPDFESHSHQEDRFSLGRAFLRKKLELARQGGEESLPERKIEALEMQRH